MSAASLEVVDRIGGIRREEGRARVQGESGSSWRWCERCGRRESEHVGLDIHTASLASIWISMDTPMAGLRRVVMRSALAMCCRTGTRKQVCT